MIEIENNDSLAIFCITESQLTRNKIKNSNNIEFIHKMRDISDKKGGGLAIYWKANPCVEITEIYDIHPDILFCEVKIVQNIFKILLVY